ncbi:MAG TPA: dienelactone hydrolase family protein [Thermomicrobiales bacterium]|nr:dienelactone hydrolase family protein [Thermomicrobiales bacterium]
MTQSMTFDPHGRISVLHHGADLDAASAAVILVHGRGATAEGMIRLAYGLSEDLENPESIAFLAPQAVGNVWYPHRFIAPLEKNEPWLSSALGALDQLVDALVEANIPNERIMLAGFSQGACLSLEYAARGSRSIGAVAAFSGGLIGPIDEPHMPLADVTGLPVFLGSGTVDDHVSPEQVRESARLFEAAGANVDLHIYEGMEHTVNDDEIAVASAMIGRLENNARES